MHDFESEIDSELVFETTTDAMAIVDAAEEQVQIATVNSAFERRFDCAEADIRGVELTAIVGDAAELQLQSRIQPGTELETTVALAGQDGDSLLRVRPLDTVEADTRSLLAITDDPGSESSAAPVGEDKTAGDRIGPAVEIASAEDVSTVQEATADLLLDGFGFDAAIVDFGDAEPLTVNVDAPIAVPRSGDDGSDVMEYDVADDRNDERWGIVVAESVDDWGHVQVAAHAAAAADPRIPEGIELVGEYVGAILDRLDRERQLQTEYREVSTFNRILRHEVLNGLNLVRARLDLVEQDISGANREHYETARVRVQNMIDQVQAIREIRTDDETAETEATPLADVVEDPVERAGENHPEASFSIVGSVPDIAVIVDDLVHFCLRNVLRNSVQHADVDDPTVRVGVSRSEGFAAIRIADNGPGIPDDLDQSVFGEGVSSLDDEGHGEGLFLTERIVEDIYGGGIRVDESDRGGAEFVIELPVAEE